MYELMAYLSVCQSALNISSNACLGQQQLHLSRDASANVQVPMCCLTALVEGGMRQLQLVCHVLIKCWRAAQAAPPAPR